MLVMSSAAVDLVSSAVLLVTVLVVSDYHNKGQTCSTTLNLVCKLAQLIEVLTLIINFFLRGCNVMEKRRPVEPLQRAAGCAIH